MSYQLSPSAATSQPSKMIIDILMVVKCACIAVIALLIGLGA